MAVFLTLPVAVADCRCGKEPADTPPAVAADAAPSVSGVADAALPRDSGLRDAGIDLKRYGDGMARGRKATVAKHYVEAVAAFTEAEAAKPYDAQALAERGYARYLARDLDPARQDLEAALRTARPKPLRGQIFFNLGLVAEAQGDEAEAYYAFSSADALTPSPATADRVDAGRGKESSLCGAHVDLKQRPTKHARDWDGTASALEPGTPGRANCLEECGGAFQWDDGSGAKLSTRDCDVSRCVFDVPSLFMTSEKRALALSLPASDGGFDVISLKDLSPARCGSGAIEATVQREGSFVHVRVIHHQIMPGATCERDGNFGFCTGDPDEVVVGSGCGDSEIVDAFDFWVEPAKKALVATVEEANVAEAPLSIHAGAGGLSFKGRTCDRTLAWP